MAPLRRFDHDEARALYATGEWSLHALGRRFGVTHTAVKRAVSETTRQYDAARKTAWTMGGVCVDCGATGVARNRAEPRCRPCADARRSTSSRPTELQCFACRDWKPDDAFPGNRSQRGVRRGRHGHCRTCQTEMKRAWRERNKVPCSHGCGTLVDAKNRRDPDKPPECQACATKRIHVARKTAAA